MKLGERYTRFFHLSASIRSKNMIHQVNMDGKLPCRMQSQERNQTGCQWCSNMQDWHKQQMLAIRTQQPHLQKENLEKSVSQWNVF
jgi:radical SAM superfamily enzyme